MPHDILLLALSTLCALWPGQETPERPNVVLILADDLADDLGYGDVACYNDRSKIPTPHIDRLAEEGMHLTDAHSPSSVCTPTRYGILTGRYAWRTALSKSVPWPWDPALIEEARLTLPKFLRGAGYRTACIGKWHLGWDWPLDGDGTVTGELVGHAWKSARRPAIGERVNWTAALRAVPWLTASTTTSATMSPTSRPTPSSKTSV